MIAVKTFAKELSGKGVTVNAAYPGTGKLLLHLYQNNSGHMFSIMHAGVCSTNIKRHMGVDKSIVGTFISKPILWFLTRCVINANRILLIR